MNVEFVDVLAEIPQDNGKEIQYSSLGSLQVLNNPCDQCDGKAVVIIRGETDSFGFEPICLCQDCLNCVDKGAEEWLEATDIEDLQAPEGMLYFFSACTSYDGHGDWCTHRKSLREITKVFRRAEDKAAPWGGLYPIGVEPELIPEQEARAQVNEHRAALEKERQRLDEEDEYCT